MSWVVVLVCSWQHHLPVTPYSRLAMPEINIGLYPDVGGGRFLADRGAVGLFTGLTGSIMTSAGAYAIGWATHICDAQRDVVLKSDEYHWEHYPVGILEQLMIL